MGIAMQMTRWMSSIGALVLIASCAIGDEDPQVNKTAGQPLQLTAATQISTEGILSFGAVVFAENSTTLLEPNDVHRYEFDGKAGGNITITVNASRCGDPDTVLDLFGPDDPGPLLIEIDDAGISPCGLDSQIANFTLPADGTYYIVVTSFLQQGSIDNGHYRLSLTCNNNACALAGAPNAATVRLNQATIDSWG